MTAVNYDDFCNLWRVYDLGEDLDAYGCEVNSGFMIFRRGSEYFYSAHCGFRGDMNNTAVKLAVDRNAVGEYDNGTKLTGGLTGDFGTSMSVTFTLNKMGERAFLISLSKPLVKGLSPQSHGGAHGVPD